MILKLNTSVLLKYSIHKIKNTSKKAIKSEWCKEMCLCSCNWKRIKDIIITIMSGLNELNGNGIYHGKLYPSNILVNERNEIVLVDYCQAKLVDTTKNLNIDNMHYLSPEHFVNGNINIKSDIFSLGSILYTLLSNEKCFKGKTKDEIKEKILKCEYYPFDEMEVKEEKDKEIIKYVNELLKEMFVVNAEERINLADLKTKIESIIFFLNIDTN